MMFAPTKNAKTKLILRLYGCVVAAIHWTRSPLDKGEGLELQYSLTSILHRRRDTHPVDQYAPIYFRSTWVVKAPTFFALLRRLAVNRRQQRLATSVPSGIAQTVEEGTLQTESWPIVKGGTPE